MQNVITQLSDPLFPMSSSTKYGRRPTPGNTCMPGLADQSKGMMGTSPERLSHKHVGAAKN